MAWLGKLDEAGRMGVQQTVDGARKSMSQAPRRTTCSRSDGNCDLNSMMISQPFNLAGSKSTRVEARVENLRQFGGPWLALHLIQTLQLDTFLDKVIPDGREHVPWNVSSLILIIARLLEPSSELFIAEQWYHLSLLFVKTEPTLQTRNAIQSTLTKINSNKNSVPMLNLV